VQFQYFKQNTLNHKGAMVDVTDVILHFMIVLVSVFPSFYVMSTLSSAGNCALLM